MRLTHCGNDVALLGNSFTIGRANGCDLTLSLDGTVSRHHAVIVKEGDDYYITDNWSTNGTLVNGVLIPSDTGTLLHDGDSIQIGKRLCLHFEASMKAAA